MSKYDGLKFLRETKARKSYACNRCGQSIESGEIYYKESVEKVNTLGLILRKFCVKCYEVRGNQLLTEKI